MHSREFFFSFYSLKSPFLGFWVNFQSGYWPYFHLSMKSLFVVVISSCDVACHKNSDPKKTEKMTSEGRLQKFHTDRYRYLFICHTITMITKRCQKKKCRKKWRGLKETTELMLIRPAQLQFFENGIKLRQRIQNNIRWKIRLINITEVYKCWILKGFFPRFLLEYTNNYYK